MCCTPHSPDFLAHVLPPSALHLDLGSSVQCSNVGLCLYLHLSPDKGSMVIFGTRPVQAPSPPLPRVLAGVMPVDTWEPL